MKKIIKELFSSITLAICVALILMNFVVSTSKVHALNNNSEYKTNEKLLINRLTKKYNVGDMVQFKQNGLQYVRRIVKINNDTIFIRDKNNNISTINIKDIVGKVVYKF